jgi:hypothetical protein
MHHRIRTHRITFHENFNSHQVKQLLVDNQRHERGETRESAASCSRTPPARHSLCTIAAKLNSPTLADRVDIERSCSSCSSVATRATPRDRVVRSHRRRHTRVGARVQDKRCTICFGNAASRQHAVSAAVKAAKNARRCRSAPAQAAQRQQ